MASSTKLILNYNSFLARILKQFRAIEIYAIKNPTFESVRVDVVPHEWKPVDPDWAHLTTRNFALSFFLNAELRKPLDLNKQALCLELSFSYINEHWIADAEIGWGGDGWHPFDEKEESQTSFEEVMNKASLLVDWLDKRFREETTKLLS